MANNTSAPIVRPLGGVAAAITVAWRTTKDTITGVSQADPFGPLQPFKPIFPAGTEPRSIQYQPAQNQQYTPRINEPLSAVQLREAALFPLAKVIIENAKDMISRMPLNVRLKQQPGETAKDYAQRKPDIGIIRMLTELIENPNAEMNRQEFTRKLCDDMLTIDAASVLLRKSAKGELLELRPVDGASITRYIDGNGNTPPPPSPAYAQLWSPGNIYGPQGGIPAVDLTTDQLIYAARNILPYRIYGCSPTEQAYPWIQVGINRLAWQGDFYTAGTVPDGIMIVPPTTGVDKIKEAQLVMNSEWNNLARRREIRLLQGFRDNKEDGKDEIIFPKLAALTDPMDELWVNYLCFAYGVSRARLAKMLNRATGQTNQEAAEKEGLEPYLDWMLNSIWNRIIQRKLGYRDYEVEWQEDTDVDPEKQSTVLVAYVKEGILERNKAREILGQEPSTDPEADQLMVDTATGPVPLNVDDAIEAENKKGEARNALAADAQETAARTQAKYSTGPGNGAPNGKPGKQKTLYWPALAKHAVKIDPDQLTPESLQAKTGMQESITRVFRRQRDKAGEEATRLIKSSPDADDTAEKLWKAVEAEFAALPTQLRNQIQQAILAGVAKGMIDTPLATGALIQEVNETAIEYAIERAAEMVGMKYAADGSLVANPSAKWAISDTTRDRLRETIKAAFEADTPKAELVKRITDLDAFSDARAEMIARTEIANAQVKGNYSVWEKSGMVKEVKWLLSMDHAGPDVCDENAEAVVKIGQPFPSGDLAPTAHPNCSCVLVASKIEEA
jgi:hypothetical protein